MYTRLLLTIGDDEFFDRDGRSNQLRLDQVVDFSRQLKVIISYLCCVRKVAEDLFWRRTYHSPSFGKHLH